MHFYVVEKYDTLSSIVISPEAKFLWEENGIEIQVQGEKRVM